MQRSFQMALLKFPRLLSVEITHALGCGFLLYGKGRRGGFDEAPHETQIVSKSFVPTNAFVFVERLLDDQQCVAGVPGCVDVQGLIGTIQPMCKTSP